MNEKIEYIRYLHQFLLSKKDISVEIIRDWIYQNSNNSELIYRLDLSRIYNDYKFYSDLLSYEQWIRKLKLNQLLN